MKNRLRRGYSRKDWWGYSRIDWGEGIQKKQVKVLKKRHVRVFN